MNFDCENVEFIKPYIPEQNPNVDADQLQFLAHYMAKLDAYEREQKEWLAQAQHLVTRKSNFDKETVEMQKSRDTVFDLQKQISDTQTQIFNERDQIFKLARENDALQLSERDEKRKLFELMSITQPNDAIEYYDSRPGNPAQRKQIVPDTSHAIIDACSHTYGFAGGVYKASLKPKHIIRTINLPNPKIQEFEAEIARLRKQLDEDNAEQEQVLFKLKTARSEYEGEIQERYQEDQAKIAKLTKQIKGFQSEKNSAIVDHMDLAHNTEREVKCLTQQVQDLKNEHDKFVSYQMNTLSAAEKGKKAAESQATKKSKQVAAKFTNQATATERQIAQLRDELANLQKTYNDKINGLEGKYKKLQNDYKRLENRRKLETNGYKAELKNLKIQEAELAANGPKKVLRKAKTTEGDHLVVTNLLNPLNPELLPRP